MAGAGRVHLVHGIHTAGQGVPIYRLLGHLVGAGFEVRYPDYGWIAAVETRVLNPVIVDVLAAYIDEGDYLVGHSNGCAIIYDLLTRHEVKVGGVAFVNAALERTITRPAWCPWIDVYFNAGDEITEAAKIAADVGIVDPAWGEMGHAGYEGPDPCITSIDCGATLGMPQVSGHSTFFLPEYLTAWGPYLAKRLLNHPTE